MIYKYIKEAIKLRKLNHQLSKDKLNILSKLLNNKKFKQNKLNPLEITEKFKFIYGHYYPIATIKKILTYKEPFKAFKFYKLGSSFLTDNNKGKIELNLNKIKVIKKYAWSFIIIGIILTIMSLIMLIVNITVFGIINVLVFLGLIFLGVYNLDEIFFAKLFIEEYFDKENNEE